MNPDTRIEAVGPLVASEVVTFPPEVDITNAEDLGANLLAAFGPGVAVVIADMTFTRFCDSSGVRQLVLAHNRAKKNGAQLRVVRPSAAVLRVLQMTGLDQVLDIRPSVDSALANAGPGIGG